METTARGERERRVRRVRWIGITGVAGLACLGVTYWLTLEPAPRVRVLWQDHVTLQQQAALERKYLLVNARDRLTEGSLAYDLLDISVSNIRALVEDPAILDTNDIERHTFVVPFDVDYGGEWMWLAHRTPVLRDRWARTIVIVILTIMAVGGLRRDGVALWRAVGRRINREARS